MERLKIGDIELLGQETLLRIVITTELSDATLSVEGAKVAVAYVQAWIRAREKAMGAAFFNTIHNE